MLSLLQTIVDSIVCWIETAAIFIINVIIFSFAALINAVVLLLPDMPDMPSVPAWITDSFSHADYYVPLGYLFTVLLPLLVTLWLAWFLLAIPLRWARAIRGTA